MRFVRLVTLLAVALLGLSLGTRATAAFAGPETPTLNFNYDSHLVSTASIGTMAERGHPAHVEADETTRSAVDPGWFGALPRPTYLGSIASHRCDDTLRLVPGGHFTATTGDRLAGNHGVLSSLRPTGVAAKSAPTVNMTERLAPHPVKPSEALDRWNDFLGPGTHTNIHPRTGVADPNRIVSADGRRSIRFGQQEMNSSPTKFHYHEETWSFDPSANAWQVDNLLVRVPFPKGAW